MSEETTNSPSSASSSPSKSASWVKFDEGESRGQGVLTTSKTTPTHSSSSGVSSVRGSVNSLSSARQLQLEHERQSHVISTQPEGAEAGGASLDVSEIQVHPMKNIFRKDVKLAKPDHVK